MLAAVVALSVTVAPSIAASFLTSQAASKKFVTNQKAAKTYVTKAQANAKAANYLSKKAAANTYVAKKAAPLPPVVGIAAGTTLYSNNATEAGYIPTAFTSFATKANVSSAVITFSGTASCTNGSTTKAPTVDQTCPVQILVDGQSDAAKSASPRRRWKARRPNRPRPSSTRSRRRPCWAKAGTRSRSSTRVPRG